MNEKKLIDGHMHLEYGPLNEEYVMRFVDEAKAMNLDEIQILDHSHRFIEFEEMYEPLKEYDVQRKWLENRQMKFKDSISDFVGLMQKIKRKDLGIKIKYGLEICYMPSSEQLIKDVVKKYDFDFLVGAIHSIDGILYDMTFSKELLWDRYDVNHIYRRYYDLLFDAVNSGLFTQLAHPDTIKMFDYYPDYDLMPTYNDLAKELKQRNIKAECNTGCFYRYNHRDIGLSDDLLRVFVEHGTEIITASDAHKPEDVGSYIEEAQERIDKARENKNV